MKIIFVANDGKQFDDEWECEQYEASLIHTHLTSIIFYNADGETYRIDTKDYKNMFDEDIYNDAEKVIIHTEEELADFLWLTETCGWIEFNQIDSVGTWVRHVGEAWYDGEWVKEDSDESN